MYIIIKARKDKGFRAQGDQKGNLESDYFTLRKWAHNLQTLGFTHQSFFLVYVGCLMRWGCNLIKLEP